MNSKHYNNSRELRETIIRAIGYGNIVKSVVVDNGHPNGPEIHQLSDTGIITIYNQRTLKMITKLIARPGQVRRYYKQGESIPKKIIELALEHQKMMWCDA